MSISWKNFEWKVAKAFATRRKLRTGTDEKADVEHDIFFIDCKLRQRWEVEKWFERIITEAEREKKIPILVIAQPRKHLRLAVMKGDDLRHLMTKAGHQEGDQLFLPITYSSKKRAIQKWFRAIAQEAERVGNKIPILFSKNEGPELGICKFETLISLAKVAGYIRSEE